MRFRCRIGWHRWIGYDWMPRNDRRVCLFCDKKWGKQLNSINLNKYMELMQDCSKELAQRFGIGGATQIMCTYGSKSGGNFRQVIISHAKPELKISVGKKYLNSQKDKVFIYYCCNMLNDKYNEVVYCSPEFSRLNDKYIYDHYGKVRKNFQRTAYHPPHLDLIEEITDE